MFKVLLPTDFSNTSQNAIVYALEMFKGFEVDFDLLHVIFYEGEEANDLKDLKKNATHEFELLKNKLEKNNI